jgi:hypothetical protein
VDDRPCSAFRPCSLNYALFQRSDVLPILLRVEGEELGSEYREATRRFPRFSVDVDNDLSREVERFRRWCDVQRLDPRSFCCMSEPRQEYWQAFARALGLPAVAGDVARALRHKPTMKQWIKTAGLPCTAFAEVADIADVIAFGRLHGYPIVLKPVDGFGALFTSVLRSAEEVQDFAPLVKERAMMVEAFVSDREYECCALLAGGKVLDIFPSIMPSPPVDAAHGSLNANISIGSREHLPVANLRDIVQTLVSGFGLERGYLHLEFFASDDGGGQRCTISELALRYPGCEIAKNHGLAYGFDIAGATIDIYLGLTPDLTYREARSVGDLLLPYKSGRVFGVMSEAELRRLPGVLEAHVAVRVGDLLPEVEPASFVCSGWVIIEGQSSSQVERRMRDVLESFHLETQMPSAPTSVVSPAGA